jgi:hypothetical protein
VAEKAERRSSVEDVLKGERDDDLGEGESKAEIQSEVEGDIVDMDTARDVLNKRRLKAKAGASSRLVQRLFTSCLGFGAGRRGIVQDDCLRSNQGVKDDLNGERVG